MIVAKLIGESDGYEVSRTFADQRSAIQWLQGAGLADFEDQTARGEASKDGKVVWTRSHLQTPESRARNEKRDAIRMLAGLNLIDKGGRL
jgi:uncharacterized protein (DUF1684 family)